MESKNIYKMYFFYNHLKIIIIEKCNLFNTIVIVIIFNILNSNFEVITANMLKIKNKTIKEIQSII